MSLRTRLLLLTLLATLLPAVLIAVRFFQDRAGEIEAETARLAVVAQRRAETINERVLGTAQLHYGLSRAADLAAGDRAACSGFLSRVRETYPQYTGILTIQPDGRLFCDSLQTGRELDLRDRSYFKAALTAKDEVLLEPTFGRLTGVAVLQIAYPVRSNENVLKFVLLASLSLQKIGEIKVIAAAPGARVLVVDHKGVVLVQSAADGASLAPGMSIAGTDLFRFASSGKARATSEITNADGSQMIWALADEAITRKAQIYVLTGAPKQSLVSAADKRLRENAVLLAAASLATFLAVWLFAEFVIRRQVARITRMAQHLGDGDLAVRIEPPLPSGELGTLMGVLNQAAQSLQQQRRDIDQLGAQLRQSQRLEAVGQLTGGVAHDFNNLLTVVLGSAELLAEQATDRPQQRALAEMIANAAQRGAVLTRQLLAFARKQALDPKPVDVNQLVAGLDPMLRRTLGEHIEIELIRGAGVWLAMVDAGQLENALLNLCLNARDAMPDGGRLTVETANARLDREYADQQVEVVPGQYVMLAVSDTGQGISPDHLEQVFEPFFTTKDKGKGTGLGLAMVYGFVKQSSGHVSIYSEPGHGTTVKLYLPRVTGDPSLPVAAVDAEVESGGAETILLVEDDDQVRRLAGDQLRSLGYTVIDVDNGTRALAVIQSRDDIALLFTDVVMPGGMNGRALADQARKIRPGLRVLYTSGYTENAIVHHGRLDTNVLLLAKPYRRSELAQAIRRALLQVGD